MAEFAQDGSDFPPQKRSDTTKQSCTPCFISQSDVNQSNISFVMCMWLSITVLIMNKAGDAIRTGFPGRYRHHASDNSAENIGAIHPPTRPLCLHGYLHLLRYGS